MTATPDLEQFRMEAARCCEETAKMERGLRGRVLNPMDDGPRAEFADEAFGIASDVAMVVLRAVRAVGASAMFSAANIWDTAAALLRAGWRPGDAIMAGPADPKGARS